MKRSYNTGHGLWRRRALIRALITGANGNVGSYLCEELLRYGYDVRAMTHYGDNNIAHLKNKLEVVRADIRYSDEVREAARGCQQIYNLAALIHVDHSRRVPSLYYETNVRGTMNVLEAAREVEADVVHMSSCEIIGDTSAVGKADESFMGRQPMSPYAASKFAAEGYCWAWNHTYGMKVNVARGFNLVGPRQRRGEKGAVIPIFVDKVMRGQSPRIYGDGEQVRDYIDVRDLARGLRMFVESDLRGELLHFCSGEPTSIKCLAEMIIEEAGVDLEPEHVSIRPGELRWSVGDNSKAQRLLGWKPTIPLRQTIRDLIDTWKS